MAWKVLLYWILEKRFPEMQCREDDCCWSMLIRYWCLGDKYQIPGFQDACVLAIWECPCCDCDCIVTGFGEGFENSPPGSKIREFVAWAIATTFRRCDEEDQFSASALDHFDSIPGLLRAVVGALNLRFTKGEEWFSSDSRVEEFLICEESKTAYREMEGEVEPQ